MPICVRCLRTELDARPCNNPQKQKQGHSRARGHLSSLARRVISCNIPQEVSLPLVLDRRTVVRRSRRDFVAKK